MSLWDFGRRFTTAARLVALPAPEMAGQLANYSEYHFVGCFFVFFFTALLLPVDERCSCRILRRPPAAPALRPEACAAAAPPTGPAAPMPPRR